MQSLQHDEAATLLPWYANGTLEDEERERVAHHLAGCTACREDLLGCLETQTASLATPTEEWEPSPGQLDRIFARIDEREAGAARAAEAAAPSASWFEGVREWLAELAAPTRWVLAGQGALVAVLALALVGPLGTGAGDGSRAQPFETLSDAPAPHASSGYRVDVDFAQRATAGEIKALLAAHRAEIVAGPTALGLYVVRFPEAADLAADEREAHRVRQLEALRAAAIVVIATPASGQRS